MEGGEGEERDTAASHTLSPTLQLQKLFLAELLLKSIESSDNIMSVQMKSSTWKETSRKHLYHKPPKITSHISTALVKIHELHKL